jgi:RimJ/RimL family protein N-acetyltransferase
MQRTRVHLREHCTSNLEAHVDWQTSELVAKHVSWLPVSPAEAKANLLEAIAQQSLASRSKFFFAVVLNNTQEVLGSVGVTRVAPGVGDCGWFIRSRYQGNGYATEAARLLVNNAFQTYNFTKLTASCRASNLASARVMAKCGFKLAKQCDDRLWFRQSLEHFESQ